ncbi:MAG TPA: hypothetical protein VJA26_10865 [Gammaproteobacteria bacterium]|nr:hypothetical protein [Gammaproteobacteria bacterium]
MRSPAFINHTWPQLVIVLAAAVGWWVGSPRYGFPRDDDIDAKITAEAIETLYAEQFAQLSAYHSAADEAGQTRLRSELDVAFAADRMVVEAAIEIRRQKVPVGFPYAYSVAPGANSACSMSTPEQLRAGLIRCELESPEGTWDVLVYTRAIKRREDTFVLAILKLDYADVRRRLR